MNRQKLQYCPTPPQDLHGIEATAWISICSSLLGRDMLFTDCLNDIESLCRIEARRDALIDTLNLRPDDQQDELELMDRYQKLANPQTFDERFNHYLGKFETNEQAYEAVEWEYRMAFDKNKYSSYDSYRNARRRRLTNK